MEREKVIMIFSLMVLFLIAGITIGFLIGSKTTHDRWDSFYERRSKEIENYCVCNYPETMEDDILYLPFAQTDTEHTPSNS